MTRAGFCLYLFVCALALTAIPAPAAAQAKSAPLPIAFVSLQRILAEADAAKAGAKELEAMRDAKAKELNMKRQALDATRLELANAGGYFSSSKRTALLETAKKQEAELQQATQQAQTEFQELTKKVQDRLRAELMPIVLDIANKRNMQYVLNQDAAVVLAPEGANLTNEVLMRLNAAWAQRQSATGKGADDTAAKVPPPPK